MTNDEFFIDDDVIISIDDNLIEEIIPNVSVMEERFKDDSTVRLNNDQINAELTNLIVDRYRNSSVLRSKVTSYAKLFLKFPEVHRIQFKALKPIIYADKLTYFTSEEDHSQNKEYEKEFFLKSEKLSHFISQFHSINRDRSKQFALQSTNVLYALYAPFASREDANVHTQLFQPSYDVDALRHCVLDEYDCASSQIESMRLISKVSQDNMTLYEGDKVNVIGFYNLVDRSKPFRTFDIYTYLTNLHTLVEGDNVQIAFNEPAFDTTGETLMRTAKGVVMSSSNVELTIKLSKPIMYKNKVVSTLVYSLKTLSHSFFVYTTSTPATDFFTKSMLKSQNILFKLPEPVNGKALTIDDVKAFIAPNSIGELIMMYEDEFKHIHNLHDLASYILIPNQVNLDHLHLEVHNLLMYVFACDKDFKRPIKSVRKTRQYLPYMNTIPLTDFVKNAGHLVEYKYDYPSYDHYVDDALNRFRYLRTQNDQGAYYVLHLLKQGIQKKYKKHVQSLGKFTKELSSVEMDVDKLVLPNDGSKNDDECERRYAKEYKKLDALLNDNGRIVFYDKKFDPTPYQFTNGFPGGSTKELKLYVLNEVSSNSNFKKLSKSELEFEVDAIVAGNRPVRLGDVCILHTSSGDVVYVRQHVEAKQMWVRKFRAPFKICTDSPLIKFNELTKVDSCIKQTFNEVCMTNKNAKVLHKYKVLVALRSELSSILSLLENYEDVTNLINADIDEYRKIIHIVPSEHVPQRKLEYVDHVDYDEYAGNEAAVGDVDYQIDFNDQANYVVAPTAYTMQGTDNGLAKQDNYDTLVMLLSFVQLSIDEKEMAFILNAINHKFPKEAISASLEKYRVSLMEQINQAVYKSNQKYMQMYDAVIKQKVDKREVELLKKYYFNVFRYLIGLIIIVIFVRYPNYVMNRIHPSCVRLLGYMGHPVSDKDTQKSLVNYFACLITNISVSEDIRFALFYEKTAQEIQKDLKEAIDDILGSNYELQIQMEITKSVMTSAKKIKSKRSFSEYESAFTSFRPSSKFGNLERMSKRNKTILRFMKSIQDVVSNSKILKQNGLNIPNLFNACCSETLLRDVDFYKFFDTYPEYKLAKNSLLQVQREVFVDENLHPPLKPVHTTSLFNKLKISQTNPVSISPGKKFDLDVGGTQTHQDALKKFLEQNPKTFGSSPVLIEMGKHFNSHDWWVDVFYPALGDEIETFESLLTRITDKVDMNVFQYLKDVIINVSTEIDVSTIRQTLYNFLATKLRLLMGKVMNKQHVDIEAAGEEAVRTNPLYAIIVSVSNNKNYDPIISQLKDLILSVQGLDNLYIATDDGDMIVKNISILAYVAFTLFKFMLFATMNTRDFTKTSIIDLTKTTDIKIKDNLRLTCDIIAYCMSALQSALQNTIVDQNKLKQTVEALREQRKQELIAAYRVDDEERELQKRLKKMGLESWADILTGEDDLISEEQQATEQTKAFTKDAFEEEKDHVYQAYKGENDDEGVNEDDDEDQFVSYEAYDN